MSVATKKAPASENPPGAVYRVPNAETLKALEEVEAGKVVCYDSVDELFADLESDDEDGDTE